MQKVLSFLSELNQNNNREWFMAHKAQYLEAKSIFETFSLELLKEIRAFDDSIGDLKLGDITYRIYRDVRFSKNKAPYKCHMGVFICRGGKKSGYGGYYFQVSAADNGGWESGHMIAAGDYIMDPKVLKVLREDIELGDGDFRAVLSKADKRFCLDTDNALKKVPAGFPADSPDSDFFRLKNFCLCFAPDTRFVTTDNLAARLAAIFRTAKPFLDYTNRAIEFVKEGN
jgi:TIGR02453 family protein